ncbi:MAG TPA: hypothetical protein VNJ04_00210 [Gemmatimonadaceae bacterium]|nr:hypothetical protein [Gemmatimonadaceae bacterium]
MKKSDISRRDYALSVANVNANANALAKRKRGEALRTGVALVFAVGLIGTGAVALPSLSPSTSIDSAALSPLIGPQLEPMALEAIESIRETAAMIPDGREIVPGVRHAATDLAKDMVATLPSSAAKITKVTRKLSWGATLPDASGIIRATAHEAIKMRKGILPLVPSKFARAVDGVSIPVSLTQYCFQGETRRGRLVRHGIVAADPRIFPLARYLDVFWGEKYLGRYLVDDTGGNVLGATLDIWNPNCKEAARFGRHWGSATMVARSDERVLPDTLDPTRFEGLAKR